MCLMFLHQLCMMMFISSYFSIPEFVFQFCSLSPSTVQDIDQSIPFLSSSLCFFFYFFFLAHYECCWNKYKMVSDILFWRVLLFISNLFVLCFCFVLWPFLFLFLFHHVWYRLFFNIVSCIFTQVKILLHPWFLLFLIRISIIYGTSL